ncbi:helix-hairpin-helix domain-containing protein [Dermabacteraceae bacterium CCM 9519]
MTRHQRRLSLRLLIPLVLALAALLGWLLLFADASAGQETSYPPTAGQRAPVKQASKKQASKKQDSKEQASPESSDTSGEKPAGRGDGTETGQEVTVYVTGQVASPGLVRLAPGSRVADAVQASGGFTGSADRQAVNLARPVRDGEQIHLPKPGEQSPSGAQNGAMGAAEDATGSVGTPAGPVDLNSAGEQQLTALPGIGPALAKRIVADREKNGPFRSIADLTRVKGIGKKLAAKLSEHARVN